MRGVLIYPRDHSSSESDETVWKNAGWLSDAGQELCGEVKNGCDFIKSRYIISIQHNLELGWSCWQQGKVGLQ